MRAHLYRAGASVLRACHALWILALAVIPLAAATIHVAPAPTGSDANDGLSWAAPKLMNRNAILAAGNGGEVIVASGTHTLSGKIDVERTVTIRSLTGNAADVRIDGNNAVQCLNITAAATFEDLTITNALNNTTSGGAMYINHADGTVVFRRCVFAGNTGSYGSSGRVGKPTVFEDCQFLNNNGGGGLYLFAGWVTNCVFSGNTGGGVRLDGSTPKVLSGCVITNNTNSSNGGGVYHSSSGTSGIYLYDCDIADNRATAHGGGLYLLPSGSVIENCRIANNTAGAGSRAGAAYANTFTVFSDCLITNNTAGTGGALYLQTGALTNCVFAHNSAALSGGAVALDGPTAGPKTFVGCTFEGNTAATYGGAIYEWSWGESRDRVFDRCRIVGNSAGNHGGAFYISTSLFRSCLLAGNQTGGRGGALTLAKAGSLIENCTVVMNHSAYANGGAVHMDWGGFAIITNSILYGNTVLSGTTVHFSGGNAAAATAAYSFLTPEVTGTGNLTGDPLFVSNGTGSGTSLVGGDFHLTKASTCIDKATGLDWMTAESTDIEGNLRVVGAGPDIGAYEYWPPPPTCTILLMR